MSIQRALVLAALTLASVTCARATTTFYNAEASLLGSAPTLTFQTIDLSSYISGPIFCSLCDTITDPITGAIFTTSGNLMTVMDATTIHAQGTVTVTLPANVLAFGAYTNSVSANFLGNLSFNGDNYFAGDFLGYRVTAGPISAFNYTKISGNLDLHGFEVGTAADTFATPETGTLVSMAAGLLLLRLCKRRFGV